MLSQYQPLFLKYRPQAISELVGQEQIVITLTNAIKYKRISHAYLFTGPRGTGKTSAARIFAKSLNCGSGPTVEPCQKCTSCIEIKQGISPSVFEIDAASNNSVDDARLLIERAPLAACGGRFKLYIIDECHMLTKEAFNALLKTIEEPPPSVIFILATTEEHKVLPTIVSRCQKLMFRLINDEFMFSHLANIAKAENILIEETALGALVRRANGGLRDALSLLDQISLLGDGKQAISTDEVLLLTGALPEDVLSLMCTAIFKGDGQQVLALLKDLFVSGREAHLVAAELAKYMLNIAKASYAEKLSSQGNVYQDLAKLVDQTELIQMIEEIDRLEVSCRRSSQPVMNLEIGLLALCKRTDITELRAIQTRLQKLENALGLTQINANDNLAEKVKLADKNTNNNSLEKLPKIEVESTEVKTLISVEPSIFESCDPTIDKEETAKEKSISNKSIEIDVIWQNILSELQRRHLPTFSLVSTHAFPIEASNSRLTIGVFVENFQKMIENKIDYIKAAALDCNFDQNLQVIVKVQANAEDKRSSVKKNDKYDSDLNNGLASVEENIGETKLASAKPTALTTNSDKHEQRAVKEAYQLFEGPGSRYIKPSQ